MSADLQEEVARTMETTVRLLPLLPELLKDLQELGTPADKVAAALRASGVKKGAAVLDLGCGKGAVAAALAEQLALRVAGIDAFPPFLEAARALAAEKGVGSSCLFREGDIRNLLGRTGQYDVVLLLSVGPVAGDHRATVAGLRSLVRPGGLIVIADGFLAEGVAPLPGYEGYADRAETIRQLTSFGEALVHEAVFSMEETRQVNETNTELIRRRASLLKARHPEMSDAIDEYVTRQEFETEILGTDLICALWTLRRAP